MGITARYLYYLPSCDTEVMRVQATRIARRSRNSVSPKEAAELSLPAYPGTATSTPSGELCGHEEPVSGHASAYGCAVGCDAGDPLFLDRFQSEYDLLRSRLSTLVAEAALILRAPPADSAVAARLHVQLSRLYAQFQGVRLGPDGWLDCRTGDDKMGRQAADMLQRLARHR